jgi:hypothetical protein
MAERACIFQHDRTTANGVVLDGLDDMDLDDRKLSYLGAGSMPRVQFDRLYRSRCRAATG